MLKKKGYEPIAGYIEFEPGNVTHQSALRIIMSTSFDKFLDEKYSKAWNAMNQVTLNRNSLKALLGEWQKTLRVSSGPSKELTQMKGIYARHMDKRRPEEPYDGCMQLQMVITFPWLGKHGKKLRERCKAVRKNTKPDVDNTTKVFMDAMDICNVLANDSRVSRLIVEKRHGEKTGVQWQLKELDPEIPRDPVIEEKTKKNNPF